MPFKLAQTPAKIASTMLGSALPQAQSIPVQYIPPIPSPLSQSIKQPLNLQSQINTQKPVDQLAAFSKLTPQIPPSQINQQSTPIQLPSQFQGLQGSSQSQNLTELPEIQSIGLLNQQKEQEDFFNRQQNQLNEITQMLQELQANLSKSNELQGLKLSEEPKLQNQTLVQQNELQNLTHQLEEPLGNVTQLNLTESDKLKASNSSSLLNEQNQPLPSNLVNNTEPLLSSSSSNNQTSNEKEGLVPLDSSLEQVPLNSTTNHTQK